MSDPKPRKCGECAFFNRESGGIIGSGICEILTLTFPDGIYVGEQHGCHVLAANKNLRERDQYGDQNDD